MPAPKVKFVVKTKAVVRHLPPGLTQDAFEATLSPFQGQYIYLAYYPGRIKYAAFTMPIWSGVVDGLFFLLCH